MCRNDSVVSGSRFAYTLKNRGKSMLKDRFRDDFADPAKYNLGKGNDSSTSQLPNTNLI